MPWGIWFDELMPDAQLSGGGLEQCEKAPFAIGEAVSELKAIVGLDTLRLNAPADIPFYKPVSGNQQRNRRTTPDRPRGTAGG